MRLEPQKICKIFVTLYTMLRKRHKTKTERDRERKRERVCMSERERWCNKERVARILLRNSFHIDFKFEIPLSSQQIIALEMY